MTKNQNLINLNFWVKKLILKKGKLTKVDFLVDKVHLGLVLLNGVDSLFILNEAIKNIMPVFLLKNRKIGKRVIISPFFILSDFSRKSIGIKWLVEAALKKKGSFYQNFIAEVMDAFNNKGSVKKRQVDLNLVVLENKSNLKYRW